MKPQKVCFLGIGGIGMSAIARFLKLQGWVVLGYDKTETVLTQELKNEGITIFFEENTEFLNDIDAVIYTPAIPKDFSLLLHAKQKNIPTYKRAEFLGLISKDFRTIAVAGTHGKTTTSGMLAHLLKCSGIDCSAFIGGITKNYSSNYLIGSEPILVVEADEFDRSFLTLNPEMAIITSVDPDHLDIYKTKEGFQEGFLQFASQVQKKVFLHQHLQEFAKNLNVNHDFYGISEGVNYHSTIQESVQLTTKFDYYSPNHQIKDLILHFPGEHNIKNLTAVITVALELGASEEGIRKGVSTFQGIQRRFDIHINTSELVMIDDYAHHPEEIHAFLQSVKKLLPDYHLIAVFQPHLFSRTNDFYREFGKTLSYADEVYLLPIYPARELPIPGVTSELIFQHITHRQKHLTDLLSVPEAISEKIQNKTAVLTIGAGDIDTIVKPLKNKLLQLI